MRMKYNEETCSVECSVALLCQLAFEEGDLGGFRREESLYGRRDAGEIAPRGSFAAGTLPRWMR